VGEVVAAHSVVFFEMADHRLDRRTPAQFAFDALGDAPLLPGDEHSEPMLRRRISAGAVHGGLP
jgi:hypothetical protein